jgi:hypothetical protein
MERRGLEYKLCGAASPAGRGYSMTSKCTIKIEEIHECGQVLGQTIISMDEYDFSLKPVDIPPFEVPQAGQWMPPIIPRPTLTITGTYNNVEVTGFEVEDGHQRCVKCGQIYSFQESEVQP